MCVLHLSDAHRTPHFLGFSVNVRVPLSRHQTGKLYLHHPINPGVTARNLNLLKARGTP
jgi:hypothetical protein